MTNSLEANFENQGSKIINIIKRKRRKPVTPEEPVHLHLASSSLPYLPLPAFPNLDLM